jgi:hypothetical protein
MGIGDCYSEKDEREARNLARDRGQTPRGEIQMDSAREFAGKLLAEVSVDKTGMRGFRTAGIDMILARDAELWRTAQEQALEKAKEAYTAGYADGEEGYAFDLSRALPLDPLPNGDNHE